MINYHPQPVEDCPCFEDAVACIAALLGTMLGLWHGWWSGLFHEAGDGSGGGTFKKIPMLQLSNPIILFAAGTRLVLGKLSHLLSERLVLSVGYLRHHVHFRSPPRP